MKELAASPARRALRDLVTALTYPLLETKPENQRFSVPFVPAYFPARQPKPDIKDLCCTDSQLPAKIQLEFVLGEKSYVIKKSFARSPSASLVCNGREIAPLKQADEAVWDLLKISPGSGRTLDQGTFGLLWVEQSASFRVPILTDSATSILNSAIEAEVGALVGGERARQLVEDINSELTRYVTEKQRPKANGPLKRSEEEVEKWQTVEDQAQDKLDALEQPIR